MIERGFSAIMVGYAANSTTGTYQMYNPDTKLLVLTRYVKCHGFDGANALNDPKPFDFTENTGQKITIRENSRDEK